LVLGLELFNKKRICGIDEKEYIVLSEQEGNIIVYVSTKVAEACCLPPNQLADKLLPVLGISSENMGS
jgi:hypothetical protein